MGTRDVTEKPLSKLINHMVSERFWGLSPLTQYYHPKDKLVVKPTEMIM